MRRIRILAIAMLLIGISLIGTGYAYQSSYESSNNIIEGQYVTLNYGVEPTSILHYTQNYDTFVNGENVTYSVPLEEREVRQKLTEESFGITITESKTATVYKLVVTSDLPTLFASSEKNENTWCRFLFVLSKDDKEYYGLTELNDNVAGSVYKFYEAIEDDEHPLAHDTDEAKFGPGTYHLDIYLVMNQESAMHNGICGVPVDKENFVDRFHKDQLTIRFTVLP